MSRNYEFDIWNEDLQDWVLDPALIEEYYQSVRWEREVYAMRDQREAELTPEPFEAFERETERRYRGK